MATLAQTDPELIEYFDNWAFDEVRTDSDLDLHTRLMVQLAAILAAGGPNPYWNRYGRTYLDPDGYRIVIAVRDTDL